MKTLEQMIEAAKAVMDEYDLVNYPHEFAADFAREQIEEALSVERSRVVAAIDALRAVRNRLHLARGAKNLPFALEMVNEALRDLDEAIEIVKGGKIIKDESSWEKREAELIKKLPKGMFEVRGLARSRYYRRLFQQGRDRPTSNEQFDEGFDAGFDVGYDAAITAEQKRVLAALEVEKRIANYGGTNYRSITQKAIDTAIEIVKGGDDD